MINFNDTIYSTNRCFKPASNITKPGLFYTAAVREQRNNFNCIKNEKINLKKIGIGYYQLGGY